MPKACNPSKAHTYQREYPAGDLFRMLCITTVNCDKKFRIEEHWITAKHEKKMQITCSASRQQFLPSSKKQFKTKLVLAFISADTTLQAKKPSDCIILCWPGASGAIGGCLSRQCPSTCWGRNKPHSTNNSRQEGIPYRWRKWIWQ